MKKRLFNRYNGMLLCAFAVPAFIMLLHYFSMEVWPLGDSSVLVLDLNGQYVYYFEALRKIIREGSSLLYTWSRALGGEFMGIFAYYLASPLSLITVLFPDGYMTEALLTLFTLKTGLCGLTMAFYLSKNKRTDHFKTVAISTMYALCSYAIVQAHNTMWIDALIYLPLLTYAVEQLVNKRRIVMYILVLSLTLMSNYYIGYMVCIYTLLYFFYYCIAYSKNNENNFYYENAHFIKSFMRIGAATVIAAAMAAWVLYPAYYSLTFGKTTFSDPDFTPALKFSPLDMLSKLFFGSYDTVEPSGLPFIYCGTLMLMLLPVYFFSKKVNARKKIMGGLLILTFALSFMITTLDLVWHGFQAPNWLNYRYSFMLIFITLVFTHDVLADFELLDFRKTVISAGGVILLLFVVQKMGYAHLSTSAVIGTIASCAALIIALYLIKNGYILRSASLILCVIVCVEMFSSAILHTQDLDTDVVISSRDSYNGFLDRVKPSVEKIKNADDGFYRTEKTFHRKTNDNFALGINGLSNSTSTLNAAQIELLQKMGYSSKSHWSKYLGGTPVFDSILGVKYIMSEDGLDSSFYDYYDEDEINDILIYQNLYALPIAYGVSKDVLSISLEQRENPFLFANELVTAMLGEEETIELFKELEIKKTRMNNMSTSFVERHKKLYPLNAANDASITYTVTAETGDRVYMYIPTEYPRESDLTVNGLEQGKYLGNDTWRTMDLGRFDEGEEIEIKLTVGDEGKIYIRDIPEDYFYYLDSELYAEIMPRLKESASVITKHSAAKLSGKVKIKEGDTLLFTTIPYDEGWNVEIDGKKAKLIKTVDSLLAVEITEGDHTIDLVYRSDAVVRGRVFSAAGTVIFVAIVILDSINRRKRAKSYRNLVDINR
ncbi:MAG: hypothetical protein E7591_07350 [Ruminococcaceae bacterium]|nr:hypothetical protein [Oscillospiraceae bacterium]